MRIPIPLRALVGALVVLAGGALGARALIVGVAPVAVVATSDALRPLDGGVRARPAVIGALTVANVTGPVERRTGDAQPWIAVRPGETIRTNDSLRTGSGGAAVLELADHTTIWLWPESQVSAERLDDELARVAVEGGRLDLRVPAREGRSVEIAARGGASAVTQGARFSIIVDGAHVATVATREGSVDVVSGTGRVRVPPGMQTRARPGESPEVVSPIPTELLLDVDWPTVVLRARVATIRGHAPPGVLVSVAGAHVVVGRDGTFVREVPLAEGDNHVAVAAQDVTGRAQVRRSPRIHVDTRPPTVGAHGRWE